jgi:ABC-2 type transport system permease protein
MRTILTLVRKDFANFFRDRTAVVLTFIIPVALIYIFGLVFGINRKDSGPSGIKLAVVNESTHPGAKKLVDALRREKTFSVMGHFPGSQPERPLTEEDLRPLMRKNEFRFAVVIPKDLIPEDRIGINFKILSNPRNEIESQTVTGLLQRTLMTSAPELLGESLQARTKKILGDAKYQQFNGTLATAIATAFGGDRDAIARRIAEGDFGFGAFPGGKKEEASSEKPDSKGASADTEPEKKSGAAGFLSSVVSIKDEQVSGQQVKSPAATRVVGGWAIMFLLFALSASAAAFFDEKKAGLFLRLLSAPVHRSHLLWSRFVYGVLLGLIQLTVLFFAGRLLYGIDVVGNLGNLIVVCTVAAAACTSFGMLLAAVSPSAQAANGLASFVILMMSATGGAWFPVSFMPDFMQTVAKFTVVYWSMEGFSQVLWEGHTFVELLPTLGILLGIAVGVMALAIWLFNRSRIFE